jgi:hypothetical protein
MESKLPFGWRENTGEERNGNDNPLNIFERENQIYEEVDFVFIGSGPAAVFAQDQAYGNLTVFSEKGEQFYLYLNGEKKNDKLYVESQS